MSSIDTNMSSLHSQEQIFQAADIILDSLDIPLVLRKIIKAYSVFSLTEFCLKVLEEDKSIKLIERDYNPNVGSLNPNQEICCIYWPKERLVVLTNGVMYSEFIEELKKQWEKNKQKLKNKEID